MTAPLPPEERHDDPRQVLIDAMLCIVNDGCAWRQSTPAEAADKALFALAVRGYQVVKATDEFYVFGARGGHDVELSNEHDVRAFAAKFGGWPKRRAVGPWRPVGEDDTDGRP